MPCIEQTILSLAQRPRVLEKEHIKPSYPHTSYTSTWYFDVFGFIIKAPSNVHVVELNWLHPWCSPISRRLLFLLLEDCLPQGCTLGLTWHHWTFDSHLFKSFHILWHSSSWRALMIHKWLCNNWKAENKSCRDVITWEVSAGGSILKVKNVGFYLEMLWFESANRQGGIWDSGRNDEKPVTTVDVLLQIST